jgi:hypothetical protein
MADSRNNLPLKVLRIYREIDQKTALLQSAFALRCPDLCGACCDSPEVEAAVVETLPLAEEIYRRKELESVPGPLVCRLFGFAARRTPPGSVNFRISSNQGISLVRPVKRFAY